MRRNEFLFVGGPLNGKTREVEPQDQIRIPAASISHAHAIQTFHKALAYVYHLGEYDLGTVAIQLYYYVGYEKEPST